MKNKTLWLVETGVLLGLLLVLQWVTKPLGAVVTGSAVNFMLIAATVAVGFWSGALIGVISPFLALLLGIVPLPVTIVPVVALGNLVLVLTWWLFMRLWRNKSKAAKLGIWICAIAVGGVLKFGALYAGVNWVVLPLVTTVTGAPAQAPAAVFSALQMLTAAIGGILALLILPTAIKAIRRNSIFSQNL